MGGRRSNGNRRRSGAGRRDRVSGVAGGVLGVKTDSETNSQSELGAGCVVRKIGGVGRITGFGGGYWSPFEECDRGVEVVRNRGADLVADRRTDGNNRRRGVDNNRVVVGQVSGSKVRISRGRQEGIAGLVLDGRPVGLPAENIQIGGIIPGFED